MTDNQSNRPSNPDEALKAIRRSRAAVHEKVFPGSWRYDIASSLIVGAMVAAQALESPWHILSIGFGGVALGNLAQGMAQKRGVWVTGVTPPRTRWLAIGLIAILGVLLMGSLVLGRHAGLPWAPLPLGMLAALIALVGSRLWLRAYRAEMRQDTQDLS